MTMRPCLSCGEPSEQTRCDECAPGAGRRRWPKASPRARGYDRRWDVLSARLRAVAVCSGCGTRDDLQGHHLPGAWERARRGLPLRPGVDVDVLCGPCNRSAGPSRTVSEPGDVTPSPPLLDQALRDRLVRDVAAKLDAQLFSASGDGITTPRGLFAYTGTQTLAVGGTLTLDHLHDAEGMVLAANVDPSRVRWLMTSREFVAVRKIKDLQDRYQVQPDPTEAGAYRLLGHPVTITNRIPDTTATPPTGRAALVDFSQIAVARDLAPSVKVLDQTFGEYDQQALRVVARYDAAALNAEAVVKLTGITI